MLTKLLLPNKARLPVITACKGNEPTVNRGSAIRDRLSAIGDQLSAISHRRSEIGYQLSEIRDRLSAIGDQRSAIRDRLSAIGDLTMGT